MNHKQKIKIARAGQTDQERRLKVSIFNTSFWNSRAEHIKARVIKREVIAQAKAKERQEQREKAL